MVKIIEKRQQQLTSILQAWNDRLSVEQKRNSINFIIPLIESASLLESISRNASLRSQLDNFRTNYEAALGADISKLGASDLSQKSVQILAEVKKIENSELALEEKRLEVKKVLAAEGLSLTDFRSQLLGEVDHKYQHAHSRVSWNYGNFIQRIFDSSNPEKKAKFSDLINEINSQENEELFFERLVEMNSLADIPASFDLLKDSFQIDGIEEHTAINQGTLYRANLDNSALIAEIESSAQESLEEKAQEFFIQNSELKSIKADTKGFKRDLNSEERSVLRTEEKTQESFRNVSNSVGKVTIGFEVEFLLLPKGGPKAEAARKKNDLEKLNKGLADIDSRKKMRVNYGFPANEIAYTPNALLLFEEDELAEIASENGEINQDKRTAVKNFLIEQKETASAEKLALYDQALEKIDLLTAEEIFCLDLFFLKNEQAVQHRYVLDDVFDWRKNREENFENILSDIAIKGSFYKKTLDMIRAHEFSIGEFPIETAKENLEESLTHLRKVASEHGLRAKDRDVQMNIGVAQNEQSLLKIGVRENNNGDKEVIIPGSTVDIGKALQRAVAKMMEDYPWTQRKGQNIPGISIGVDRKKVLLPQLQGSPYFVSYDEEKHTPSSSAFPVHRDNTGKSGVIRLACIDENLAVYELRLISNNTHVPSFDEAPREIVNGIELVPEIFIPYLANELEQIILNDKTEGEVLVNYNGSVNLMPPLQLKRAEEIFIAPPSSPRDSDSLEEDFIDISRNETPGNLIEKPTLHTTIKSYQNTI
jgi:hypothetical protein